MLLLLLIGLIASITAQICNGDRDCTVDKFCIKGTCQLYQCFDRVGFDFCPTRQNDPRDPQGCVKYYCDVAPKGYCVVYNCIAVGQLCNPDPDGPCFLCSNDTQCPQFLPSDPCTRGVCNKPNVNTRCVYESCARSGLYCKAGGGCTNIAPQPTPQPTPLPTATITPPPTRKPTGTPTGRPTSRPTGRPTGNPTPSTSSLAPSARPTTPSASPAPTDTNGGGDDISSLTSTEIIGIAFVVLLAVAVLFFFCAVCILRSKASKTVYK